VCTWRGAWNRGGGGEANWHALWGTGKLRLILCITRIARNGARLRRYSLRQSLQDQPPPRMFCLVSRATNAHWCPPPRVLCTLWRAACVHAVFGAVTSWVQWMRMHCTRLVVVLNTTYQLVFWNASQTALSSSGPLEATLCQPEPPRVDGLEHLCAWGWTQKWTFRGYLNKLSWNGLEYSGTWGWIIKVATYCDP